MPYYFVSSVNFDGQILCPMIPESKNHREDSDVARICVSKSLLGCLHSTRRYAFNKKIYVHSCESSNVITPTRKQVNDSYMTGEEWILEPVLMKLEYEFNVKKKNLTDQISEWRLTTPDQIDEFSIFDYDYRRMYRNAK